MTLPERQGIPLSALLRLRADVRYRIVDDEAVVVRQGAGRVMALNGVGARVLELAAGGAPVEQVIDALSREYEVERDELQRDVVTFVHELVEGGVFEVAGAGGE